MYFKNRTEQNRMCTPDKDKGVEDVTAPSCPICFESLEGDSTTCAFPCGHVFCLACMARVFSMNTEEATRFYHALTASDRVAMGVDDHGIPVSKLTVVPCPLCRRTLTPTLVNNKLDDQHVKEFGSPKIKRALFGFFRSDDD